MNSNEEGFQHRLAVATSKPESAQRFLYLCWVLSTEWLKRQAAELENPDIPPRNNVDIPEWACKTQGHINKIKRQMEQLRRVESYLGHKPKEIDPRIIEDVKCLAASKWIRAAAQYGYSDEENAAWLKNFLTQSTKGKRGRIAGTVDSDGHALLALVLYEWEPKAWSFPKLADHFCNKHKPHTADSDCVDKLKKAVKRLRAFLQELGYKRQGK